jgi:selenocysteine lyase/cysteine desulfurase
MGFLWGKRELLEKLPTFREDFIPDQVPTKIEVGTFVYENVAGMNAAIAYLEELGRKVAKDGNVPSSRILLVAAMEAIRKYEAALSAQILERLSNIDGVTIYGIHESDKLARRVPTICFNLKGLDASSTADQCAAQGVGVRDGNMYSPRLLHRMGIAETGAVRASLVHYNTAEEIDKFAGVLENIVRQ